MSDEDELQQRLISGLLAARAYPHPAPAVEHIETHISHILLAGGHAYKIKKPLDLGFLDYRGLHTRRHYCEQELRLNRRTAPDIYLGIVGIGGAPDAPLIVDPAAEECLEYAVHMRRFEADALLSTRLQSGGLDDALIDVLAEQIADFHQSAARVSLDAPWGLPQQVEQPVLANFEALAGQCDAAQLARLRAWVEQSAHKLLAQFMQRRHDGRVRECHGDLHLGNIVLWQGRPCLFDGIEFNQALRWIDVISDIAFLMMDLEERGRGDGAWRLINHYLEFTGDYAGLALLDHYRVYRAMVRAKVAAIRLQQADLEADGRQQALAEMTGYLELAESYTRPPRPLLLLTSGLSGSGKTWVSQRLLQSLGLIRVRSDVERKRLYGLSPLQRSESAVGAGIYTPEAGRRTYQRLQEVAAEVIAAGHGVIVDATFLGRKGRSEFLALAQRLGVPALILRCEADRAVLRARVLERESQAGDASEAGLAVLQGQLDHWESPDEGEQDKTLVIDTGGPFDLDVLLSEVRQRLGLPV